jgi:hypothetical protein
MKNSFLNLSLFSLLLLITNVYVSIVTISIVWIRVFDDLLEASASTIETSDLGEYVLSIVIGHLHAFVIICKGRM